MEKGGLPGWMQWAAAAEAVKAGGADLDGAAQWLSRPMNQEGGHDSNVGQGTHPDLGLDPQ